MWLSRLLRKIFFKKGRKTILATKNDLYNDSLLLVHPLGYSNNTLGGKYTKLCEQAEKLLRDIKNKQHSSFSS